jgi:hypothetical protein
MRQGYVSAEICVSKLLYEIAMCMCVCERESFLLLLKN